MATVYMSEDEVARDLHAALTKVKQGCEVFVEQDNIPVAVMSRYPRSGRLISEILAEMEQRHAQEQARGYPV